MSTSFIVLDRDGVINYDSDDYIKSIDEWKPLPGSIDAIANLSKAGYIILVATNQSGLARGYFDEVILAQMHSLLCQLVEEQGGIISGIFFCPHLPTDNCRCRKPSPGLLEQMEAEYKVDLNGSWFIGDSEKDIDVAITKNCKPILVLTGKGQKTKDSMSEIKLQQSLIFNDLLAASKHILSH